MDFLTEEWIYQKNSQQLTALLYEGLLECLEEAIAALEQKDYWKANKQLQKGNDILRRLGVGLRYDAGIIAHQLDALYNYMAERLIEANMKKDVKIVQEVLQLTATITTAWNEALKSGASSSQTARKSKTAAYEQFIAYEQS
ncbi:flagellar export chaperone FliS [Geobacillus stearothermophilus]|uniref:flagellar export chaperone FliS n=1 Tax=Geobacillus stearothermophilus TaxID=1422 RepID=UPI000EF560F3|nr:flagellar export chaperone FliS [Geobacillus stearothermophilus]RLQ00888.1 flagellar export chaperone FliS [Geobacillus stearothermophilus]